VHKRNLAAHNNRYTFKIEEHRRKVASLLAQSMTETEIAQKLNVFRCLLSPDAEDSALFFGINKVIARALEDDESPVNNIKNDDNNTFSITPTSASIYPCKVLNRFSCPYDNKSGNIKTGENLDVNGLFALYNLAFQVELAFNHAYSMSKSNETIYEADFEAGKVK
jgi:hypothetical protein